MFLVQFMLSLLTLLWIGVISSSSNSNSYRLSGYEKWSLETYYRLRADVTCCPQHGDEASCNDEGGSNCIWFNNPNDPIPTASGSQCVGRSYAKCKRDNGITSCCSPSCNGGGPPGPTQPGGGPGGIPTPPVCGPSSAGITPQPTTKAPTTKSPTTKSPTTKSPTTKSPTTKSPTTKSPTTKSPTTKAPTTKSPTTKSPTTKHPTTKSPTTKSPTTKSPTTKSPTTKSPTTKSPTTKAPTTKSPTTKHPTTKSPTTKAPTTKAPTTKSPTTQAPTTKTPTKRPTSSPTTAQPTIAPTNEKCEIGVNYLFEGYPCQISGDPHTRTHHGDRHDFQGIPSSYNANNELQNQFYYIARCCDASCDDMPFQILGTHYYWGTRPVSGIDYLTFELCGGTDPGKTYIYLSSSFAYYARGGTGISTNYDITRNNGGGQALPSGNSITLNGRFNVLYTSVSHNQAKISISIIGGGTIYVYMRGQMGQVTDTVGTFTRNTYRMHYVYIKQDSLYKCASCGLCGDFQQNQHEQFEACDCTQISYRPGWNFNNVPEAYDQTGWTYEYNYFNSGNCINYDPTTPTPPPSFSYTDPCNPNIAGQVATACENLHDSNSHCCNNVIGGPVCDDLVEDCKFDACVIATDTNDINGAVQQTLGAAIAEACNIPNVGDDNDPDNLQIACQNNVPVYNVQFILDESGSVGASNYDNSVVFVQDLIRLVVNQPATISVYSFSNIVDKIYGFNQDQISRNGVVLALDGAKSTAGAYQGRCTNTLAALEDAVAEFERADNDGDLNDPGDRYLFLITDGVPYCGCGLSSSTCKPDVCGSSGVSLRNRINAANIRVFTLGIGNFDITTIQCLSDANDVFQISSFTEASFKQLEADVKPVLCPDIVPPAYILDIMSEWLQTDNNMEITIIGGVIACIGLIYYYRYKQNNKDLKYIPINDPKIYIN